MNFIYETDRLILKVLNQENASQVLSFYQQNKEVFEKIEPINAPNFYTLEHQQAILHYEYEQILRFAMIRFWIFEKEDPDKVIGTICFHDIRRPIFESCVVGYKIDTAHTGRGYCHEALDACISIMFGELMLHRIEAYVMPQNLSSIHLLEVLGFKREGLIHDKVKLNDQWEDHYLYSLINK